MSRSRVVRVFSPTEWIRYKAACTDARLNRIRTASAQTGPVAWVLRRLPARRDLAVSSGSWLMVSKKRTESLTSGTGLVRDRTEALVQFKRQCSSQWQRSDHHRIVGRILIVGMRWFGLLGFSRRG